MGWDRESRWPVPSKAARCPAGSHPHAFFAGKKPEKSWFSSYQIPQE
jgi:hypothetical protein